MIKKLLPLFCAIAVCVTLAGCSSDKAEEPDALSVTLNPGTQTTYVVNADNPSISAITFTATSAWTISVDPSTGSSTSSADVRPLDSNVSWIKLNTYSGNAGTHHLTITIEPNKGTTVRHARIRISGANNTIFINISQKEFVPTPDEPTEGVSKTGWTLVWADEFDGEDNSQPSSDKWVRSNRYSSTWNRYISTSEDVIFIEDGKLVARTIPNPDQGSDPVPMLTGAVETRSKFEFTYGLVSVKALTNPFTGSFPAIWMMPAPPTQSWPAGGEIDIWEQINTSNVGYHTIHSRWRDTLGNANNPTSSFTSSNDYSKYHVYELEWDANKIVWYVDGVKKGTYSKSSSQDALNNGQWPFDAPFYLILNQSVGDGSWANNPNTSHTYETRFEYARVYQK